MITYGELSLKLQHVYHYLLDSLTFSTCLPCPLFEERLPNLVSYLSVAFIATSSLYGVLSDGVVLDLWHGTWAWVSSLSSLCPYHVIEDLIFLFFRSDGVNS